MGSCGEGFLVGGGEGFLWEGVGSPEASRFLSTVEARLARAFLSTSTSSVTFSTSLSLLSIRCSSWTTRPSTLARRSTDASIHSTSSALVSSEAPAKNVETLAFMLAIASTMRLRTFEVLQKSSTPPQMPARVCMACASAPKPPSLLLSPETNLSISTHSTLHARMSFLVAKCHSTLRMDFLKEILARPDSMSSRVGRSSFSANMVRPVGPTRRSISARDIRNSPMTWMEAWTNVFFQSMRPSVARRSWWKPFWSFWSSAPL